MKFSKSCRIYWKCSKNRIIWAIRKVQAIQSLHSPYIHIYTHNRKIWRQKGTKRTTTLKDHFTCALDSGGNASIEPRVYRFPLEYRYITNLFLYEKSLKTLPVAIIGNAYYALQRDNVHIICSMTRLQLHEIKVMHAWMIRV